MCDKRLVSRIYKELVEVNNKRQIIHWKNEQENWIGIVYKEYRQMAKHTKNAQHHESLEERKSKPGDTTPHPLGSLLSKNEK